MAIIVIDPGHGGDERVGGSSPNNATGANGLLEKDLTLDLGLRLLESLPRGGHEVILTRTEDVNLSLEDRAAVAAGLEANAFVSIHLNGFNNPSVQGSEVFHHVETPPASRMLADRLLDALLQATRHRNRGVKTSDRLGVLRPDRHAERTAACLVEVSFLTDPDEADRFARDDYRQLVAAALDFGIRQYLFHQEREEPAALFHFAANPTEGCFG